MAYEASATAWVARAAPAQAKTRSLGRLDLAWSLGLLIGVPGATALANISWRLAYVALAIIALPVLTHLIQVQGTADRGEPTTAESQRSVSWSSVASQSWPTFLAFGAVAGAGQMAGVVFGIWLTERFGLAVTTIGGVAFVLGLAELAAITTTIRLADRIGSTRSARIGSRVLLISGLALSVSSGNVYIGVLLLAVLLASHEFALVSAKQLLAATSPQQPAIGIGLGFGVAAAARALAAVGGIASFQFGGMPLTATLAASLGLMAHSFFGVARDGNQVE